MKKLLLLCSLVSLVAYSQPVPRTTGKMDSWYGTGTNLTLTGLTSAGSFSAGNALIYETTFPGTALPTDWSSSGAWTVSNGLVPPGTGGWGVSSVYNKRTGQDRSTIVSRVTVTDITAQFGLVRKDIILTDLVGSVGMVDGLNNVISIMGNWNSSTMPALSNSVALATMTTGRDYVLRLSKTDAGHVTFSITDTVTGTITSVSTTTHNYGQGYSGPGAISISGAVKFKNMRMYANVPRNPRVAIYGDSYVEGDSLVNQYDQRWAYKVYTNLHGNCLIAGIGGESSIGFQLTMDRDVVPFKPQFCVFALGYNDSTFSTWKANIELMAAQARAIGAIPVFTTMPPRVSNQAFLTQVNNWLTITNDSQYRFIDIGAALTVGGDRLTWEPTYLLGDGIHPTVAGHVAIYNQVCVDLLNDLVEEYSDAPTPGVPTTSAALAAVITDETGTGALAFATAPTFTTSITTTTASANQTSDFRTTTSGTTSLQSRGYSSDTTPANILGGGNLVLENFTSTANNYSALKFRNAASSITSAIEGYNVTHGAPNEGGLDYIVRLPTSGTLTHAWRMSSSGDLVSKIAGAGLQVKEGSNARMGSSVLVGGAVVVSNTSVTANSRIYVTSNVDGGTPGWLRVSARTAATSFTITSSSGTDTSTVSWIIVEPSP